MKHECPAVCISNTSRARLRYNWLNVVNLVRYIWLDVPVCEETIKSELLTLAFLYNHQVLAPSTKEDTKNRNDKAHSCPFAIDWIETFFSKVYDYPIGHQNRGMVGFSVFGILWLTLHKCIHYYMCVCLCGLNSCNILHLQYQAVKSSTGQQKAREETFPLFYLYPACVDSISLNYIIITKWQLF